MTLSKGTGARHEPLHQQPLLGLYFAEAQSSL